MINRPITYERLLAYFEGLADAHVLIDAFVGFSRNEFAERSRSREGLQGFALVMFGYSGTLDGNSQRTISRRTVSFAVLKARRKRGDYGELYGIVSEAEEIGLAILSRIWRDARTPGHFLYNAFEKDSVRFSEVLDLEGSDFAGTEFHFTLKVGDPLTVDPEDWKDLNDVCDDSVV